MFALNLAVIFSTNTGTCPFVIIPYLNCCEYTLHSASVYPNLVNWQPQKVSQEAGFGSGKEINHHQLQKKALMNVDMFA